MKNGPVEVARAALSALTFTQSEELLPAHVNRIASVCVRLGGADCASALTVLEQLREAQHLGNGYWVPTPTRVVQIPGQQLVISALPTSELIRGIGNIRHSNGFARLVEGMPPASLPWEEYDQWLGAPKDIRKWTENAINSGRERLKATVHPSGQIWVYAPWLVVARGRQKKRWIELSEWAIERDELVVCRQGTGIHRRNFWAVIKHARVSAESPIGVDLLRLLYGLNVVNKAQTSIQMLEVDGLVQISMPPLPAEETRLVVALARGESKNGKESYVIEAGSLPIFVELFERLGFMVRH